MKSWFYRGCRPPRGFPSRFRQNDSTPRAWSSKADPCGQSPRLPGYRVTRRYPRQRDPVDGRGVRVKSPPEREYPAVLKRCSWGGTHCGRTLSRTTPFPVASPPAPPWPCRRRQSDGRCEHQGESCGHHRGASWISSPMALVAGSSVNRFPGLCRAGKCFMDFKSTFTIAYRNRQRFSPLALKPFAGNPLSDQRVPDCHAVVRLDRHHPKAPFTKVAHHRADRGGHFRRKRYPHVSRPRRILDSGQQGLSSSGNGHPGHVSTMSRQCLAVVPSSGDSLPPSGAQPWSQGDRRYGKPFQRPFHTDYPECGRPSPTRRQFGPPHFPDSRQRLPDAVCRRLPSRSEALADGSYRPGKRKKPAQLDRWAPLHFFHPKIWDAMEMEEQYLQMMMNWLIQ